MKEFVPLFLDFNETTQDLTDAECGRLVRAVVRYANGDEYDHLLQGAERIAFRFLQGYVDRNRSLSAVRAAAGSKGGQQTAANSSKLQQTPAKNSKDQQTAANGSKIANNNNNNNKNNNNNENIIADDEAAAIQNEHNRVLDAAEDAGFKMSNAVRAGLLNLYAEHGAEKLLDGLASCTKHGAPTLAYLEAVLKGTGKKQKTDAKEIHGYDQRSYEGEQKKALQRMMEDDWGDEEAK